MLRLVATSKFLAMQPPRSNEAAAPEVEPLLYTPDEASPIVNLKPHWLIANARKGLIPHRRIGRYYRFAREDLEEIKRMFAQPVKGRSRRGV